MMVFMEKMNVTVRLEPDKVAFLDHERAKTELKTLMPVIGRICVQ